MKNIGIGIAILVLLIVAGYGVFAYGLDQQQQQWVASLVGMQAPEAKDPLPVPDHQDPAAEEEVHSLALGKQSLLNIGIDDDAIRAIAISDFPKWISFPGMVVERPGLSTTIVPSPVTGVVTSIFLKPGQEVRQGEPLFDLSLNHDDVTKGQATLIADYRELEIVDQEIERLKPIGVDIAPNKQRELLFKKTKLEGTIQANREFLKLHGLSEKEITDVIQKKKEMVQTITVKTPLMPIDYHGDHHDHDSAHKYRQMSELLVKKGQQVRQGDPLCSIADYTCLFVEGDGYVNQESIINEAFVQKRPVRIIFEKADGQTEIIDNQRIRRVGDRIKTRSAPFFVELPNYPLTEPTDKDRYFAWRYKPNQRCRVEVSLETIKKCIVLPVQAVAWDGPEASVFVWNGMDGPKKDRKVWTKTPVHVLYRTPTEIVIDNNGQLFPGNMVAVRGASQLLMALTSGSGKLQSTCPCGDH